MDTVVAVGPTTTTSNYDALLEKFELALEENASLRAQVDHLKRMLFGRKSEKTHPGQLSLFGPSPEEAAPEEAAAEDEPPAKKKRRRGKSGRLEIPEDLPRHDIVIDVPESDRSCDLCSADMVPFKDAVTERVKIIPAQAIVLRTVRKQYRCPDGHRLAAGPMPPEILPRSKYDSSVAVHLAIAKFADHLPLHRQVEILKRSGILIPKSTAGNLILRVGELLAPVVDAMKQELLRSSYIQSDDTPITVIEEGQKGSRRGHVWVWLHKHLVVFRFLFSRGRDAPISFLGNWQGHLQSDGLSSYDAVVLANELEHHGCWSHCRRKFVDASRGGDKRADKMVHLINRLFRIERAARLRATKDEDLAELLATVRPRRSLQMLDRIGKHASKLEADRSVLPKSALGGALTYLNNQWLPLTRFVEAPEVEIHNNAAERALRAIAVGRKNWLFAGSPRGAKVAATLFSVIGTCRVLKLPIDRYLTDAVDRLIADPGTDPATLTPWSWARSEGLSLPNAVADPD